MSKADLFMKENITNLTSEKTRLQDIGQSYVVPGRVHPIVSIEEMPIGFKFCIVCTQDELSMLPDDDYNRSINPDVEFTSEDIVKILSRWPSISMDMFKRGPVPAYSMILLYFNKDIIGNRHAEYPPEGLYVVDIIPHSNPPLPIDYNHKKNFAKALGLHVLPLKYGGDLSAGFQRLEYYANTGEIPNSGVGTGVRVTFEPRIDFDVFVIDSEQVDHSVKYSETVDSLARELGRFMVTPDRIITVHENSGVNPKRAKKKFANKMMDYVKDTTGYFSEYYGRAVLINESLTREEFDKIVYDETYKTIQSMIENMDAFKLK